MDNGEEQGPKSEKIEKKKGGRKGWATVEQDFWLRARVPNYLVAQGGGPRALAEFWSLLWEEWFLQWPESVSPVVVAATTSASIELTTDQQDMLSDAVQGRKSVSVCTVKLANA